MNNDSITGSKSKMALIFEQRSAGACAVSLPRSDVPAVDRQKALGKLAADSPPALPEVGELDLIRHYTRLADRCLGIDTNFYPLGSCTMKYNPRVNERIAAMPGFAHMHPYQDDDDCHRQ